MYFGEFEPPAINAIQASSITYSARNNPYIDSYGVIIVNESYFFKIHSK